VVHLDEQGNGMWLVVSNAAKSGATRHRHLYVPTVRHRSGIRGGDAHRLGTATLAFTDDTTEPSPIR
jgi:hypothetical protein